MYKVDRKNLKKERNVNLLLGAVGLIFLMIGFFMFGDKDSSVSFSGLIIFVLFCGLLIWLGIDGVKKYNEKMTKLDYLEQYGRVERGLEYRMEPTGTIVNGKPIFRLVVDYELDSGAIITLHSEGRYDHKLVDADGLVDVLIDPNNPNNYYIDFHIEERY